jgi:hypothetical protein
MFLLVSDFAYCSIQKMEVMCSGYALLKLMLASEGNASREHHARFSFMRGVPSGGLGSWLA